jgi:flagellar hook-length control protein FliK
MEWPHPNRRSAAHPVRLLASTVVALGFAAAFAGTAHAGLGSLGGQADPLAPLSSTLTGVSPTGSGATSSVTGTLDTATSATNQTLGAVGSTVDETQETLTMTVDDTVGTAGTTLGAITTTTTSTVDQTLAPVVGGAAPAPAPQMTTPSTPAPSAATSEPQAAASVVATHGDPTSATSPRDVRLPSPQRSPGTRFQTRDRASAAVADRARASTGARGIAATPLDLPRPAGTGARSRAASAPVEPRQPIPPSPTSLLTMLFGSPGTGVPLVTGALLAALVLLLFGWRGPRMRALARLLRPPDVLFSLERPG